MATFDSTAKSDFLLKMAQDCFPDVPVSASSSGEYVVLSREFLATLVVEFNRSVSSSPD